MRAKGQGRGSTDLDALVASAGATITGKIPEIGVLLASSSNPAFMTLMSADKRVQQVAENIEVPWLPNEQIQEAQESDLLASGVNTEPFFATYQWNIRQIHADQAAANGDQGWGVKRARVAVLDAGIWSGHPDIASNLNTTLSRSFVPTEPGIDPVVYGFNHGTHVAGIIAAPINDRGVQGVAPRAEIVAVKVLRSGGGGGSFAWLIQGLMYASGPEVQADVINMSLGATFDRINADERLGGPAVGLPLIRHGAATAAPFLGMTPWDRGSRRGIR